MAGSADGYNSESPERLHIDYAKAAYHASNKRDYMEQMAIWLQRQESIWKKQSYLMWVHEDLPSLLKSAGREDDDVEEVDNDDEGGDHVAVVTLCDLGTKLPITDSTSRIWEITKKSAYLNMSAEQLATRFGALDFLAQLSNYLGARSTFSLNSLDRFNVYCQVKLFLPPNHYVSNQTRSNRIRTTPAVPRKG